MIWVPSEKQILYHREGRPVARYAAPGPPGQPSGRTSGPLPGALGATSTPPAASQPSPPWEQTTPSLLRNR